MKHSGFKYRYRQKLIERSVLNGQRRRQFPNISAVQTIGIVGDELVEVKKLQAFFNRGANTQTLLFSFEKRMKGDERTLVFMNDLNFWGLPHGEQVQAFVQQPFDLLINLLSSPFDPADFVSARSMARLKIAQYERGAVYDLIIRQNEPDIYTYMNEIVKTLNNFNQ